MGCSVVSSDCCCRFGSGISRAIASSSSFAAAKSLNSSSALLLSLNSYLAFRLMKNDLKKEPS